MHAEFKLSGEKIRSSTAAYKYWGSPRRSASTTFEVKDPLEPVAADFKLRAYAEQDTQKLGSLFNRSVM